MAEFKDDFTLLPSKNDEEFDQQNVVHAQRD